MAASSPSVIDVSLVQFAPRFGARDENLDAIEAAVGDLRSDLVVLPELATSGYSFIDRAEVAAASETFPDGPTTARWLALSRRTGGFVVGGFVEREGDHLYNASVIVSRGRALGTYRKVHLFGFEREVFDPGDRRFAVHADHGLVVGTMICFDWVYPEAARSLALLGADVIAHPSNLVLPGRCQAAMPIRAMENLVATATANRHGVECRPPRPRLAFTGESLLVEAGGRVVARGPADGPAIVRGTIDVSASRLKRFPSGNDLIRERRPDLYIGGPP